MSSADSCLVCDDSTCWGLGLRFFSNSLCRTSLWGGAEQRDSPCRPGRPEQQKPIELQKETACSCTAWTVNCRDAPFHDATQQHQRQGQPWDRVEVAVVVPVQIAPVDALGEPEGARCEPVADPDCHRLLCAGCKGQRADALRAY